MAGLVALSSAAFAQESGADQQLKVAAVQFRTTGGLAENTARIASSIRDCARDGARVVVFPECALTGISVDAVKHLTSAQLEHAEKTLSEACRAARVYAIVGTAWRDEGRLLNSALVIAPSGRVIERYHKVQLAESWPEPGDHLSVFSIDGIRCSIIICHDERYPELVRLPVLAGAVVVFYISHESGLGEPHKLEPYHAQIQARAVENSVFVVQANAPANPDKTGSHGQSRVVAPDGNILDEASIYEDDLVTATLDLRKATRRNALNSLSRGPLREWWKEGIKLVRIIE
jgi:predicted amidohydrolase